MADNPLSVLRRGLTPRSSELPPISRWECGRVVLRVAACRQQHRWDSHRLTLRGLRNHAPRNCRACAVCPRERGSWRCAVRKRSANGACCWAGGRGGTETSWLQCGDELSKLSLNRSANGHATGCAQDQLLLGRAGEVRGIDSCLGTESKPKTENMDFIGALQWPAMLATVAAAWLVASQSKRRRAIGFWVFLLSNVLWVVWGWSTQAWALVALQFALAALNIRGASKND